MTLSTSWCMLFWGWMGLPYLTTRTPQRQMRSQSEGFTAWLHQLVISLIFELVSNFQGNFKSRQSQDDKLRPWREFKSEEKSCELCFFGKSRVNSGYLWVRLRVRTCLAVFTNSRRPHSVSGSRPKRQHPWEKQRERVSQIILLSSHTLKCSVVPAETHKRFLSTEYPVFPV